MKLYLIIGATWVFFGWLSWCMLRRYYLAQRSLWISRWGADDSYYQWNRDTKLRFVPFFLAGPIGYFSIRSVYGKPPLAAVSAPQRRTVKNAG